MKLTKQKLNEYKSNLLKLRPDLLNKIITENFRCYVFEIIGIEYENCFVIQNLTLSEKSKPVYDTISLRIVEKFMNDSKPDLLNNDVIVYNSNQIFGDSDISSENINCAYINGTVFFFGSSDRKIIKKTNDPTIIKKILENPKFNAVKDNRLKLI